MKRMKRLSFQWRITLLTAILIAGTCICSNLLLYRSGTVGIDSLNGFVMEYDPESSDVLNLMISRCPHFSISFRRKFTM